MPLVYQFLLERDLDGAAAYTDLTPYVLEARWRLGARDAGERMAPPGEAVLHLYDPDNALALNQPAAPLAQAHGATLTIMQQTGAGVRTLFTGAVALLAFEPAARRVQIAAYTADTALAHSPADLPAAAAMRAGDLIAAVLTSTPVRRTSLAGLWMLDAPAASALGSSTRLAPDAALPAALDAGISTFAYAPALHEPRDADDVLPTAAAVIRAAVESERGRWFVSREGVATFHDRHRPLRAKAAVYGFDESLHALLLEQRAADHANLVRVLFEPLTPEPDALLWELPAPRLLPPGETLLDVRAAAEFRALLALPVVAGLSAVDTRTGAPATVYAAVRAAYGPLLRLALFNPGAAVVRLLALTVRGAALRAGAFQAAEARDPVSVTRHGPRLLALAPPLLRDAAEAADRAQYECEARRQPRPLLHQLTAAAHDQPAMLALTIGDVIAVRERRTLPAPLPPPGDSASDARWRVLGEAHHLAAGGARHLVTYTLEPALERAYWEIGVAALDSATRLAY